MAGNANSGSTTGSVAGTPESAVAGLILRGQVNPTDITSYQRRGLVDQWTAEHEDVIFGVLDRMALIAVDGKSDRDAIAAGKVLLDHTQGRPPEAVEAKPNQTLHIHLPEGTSNAPEA